MMGESCLYQLAVHWRSVQGVSVKGGAMGQFGDEL